MKLVNIFSLVLGAHSLVAALTPPGVCPHVRKNLTVNYGFAKASGELLPQPELGTAPTIYAKLLRHKYFSDAVLFMIDLDVPRNGTRLTLLHWFAYNVSTTTYPFTIPAQTASGPGAAYLQPNPPAGDVAHRYVFLLYRQPKNFAVPASFKSIDPPANTTARIGFNLTKFVEETGLEKPIVANYIQVKPINATPAASTTFPPVASSTGKCKGTKKWW